MNSSYKSKLAKWSLFCLKRNIRRDTAIQSWPSRVKVFSFWRKTHGRTRVVVPATVFLWNRFSWVLSGFYVGFSRFYAGNRIVITGVEPKMTKKCVEPFFRFFRGNQYQRRKTKFGDLRLLSISPPRTRGLRAEIQSIFSAGGACISRMSLASGLAQAVADI